MPTLQFKVYINNVLADPTGSVVRMSDPTGAYGVKRADTNAVVVADGTSMTRNAQGDYRYTFVAPAVGLTYQWYAEFDYGGTTYHFPKTFVDGEEELTESSVIDKARKITGNKTSVIVGELGLEDADILAGLSSYLKTLNGVCGNAGGLDEVIFTATPGQQDYPLSDVATNIDQIQFVLREAANYDALVFGDVDVINPTNGLPMLGRLCMDPMFSGGTLDTIIGMNRQRLNDRFSYEVIGGRLRLMPYPQAAEQVCVRYTVKGGGVDSLPAEATDAAVAACCVVIFNLQLNRILSSRPHGAEHGLVSDPRIGVLRQQRDYYEQEYQRELSLLGG